MRQFRGGYQPYRLISKRFRVDIRQVDGYQVGCGLMSGRFGVG